MDLDLNMLLAICKASTWFTGKQRKLLFLEDNANQESNTKLQNSNKQLAAQLKTASAELAKAKEELAKAAKAPKLNPAMGDRVLKAINLLTSVSNDMPSSKASAANKSNQLNPNNPNYKPPKR